MAGARRVDARALYRQALRKLRGGEAADAGEALDLTIRAWEANGSDSHYIRGLVDYLSKRIRETGSPA